MTVLVASDKAATSPAETYVMITLTNGGMTGSLKESTREFEAKCGLGRKAKGGGSAAALLMIKGESGHLTSMPSLRKLIGSANVREMLQD